MKYESVEQAQKFLLDKVGATPQVAIVLGSGLSAVDEILTGAKRIHYVSIPHFPVPKVAGHRGQVVYGKISGMTAALFEGRVHYYEGNSMEEVTFCTRVIARMGAQTLILTNASGAINPDFQRGQLMMIKDHINLIGVNPLRGPNEDRWGPRFVDQTDLYDPALRKKLTSAAEYSGVKTVEGVYAAMPGPSYETPAEIRMLRAMGADCVGMSTVPEAIVARHMGMKVGGISMVANMAAGVSGAPVNHEEVLQAAQHLNADIGMLFHRFFETYDK
jgi:purine-nucleoside phosphorylase